MNTLEIAWRNVRRNGRRSLLTALALAVGTLAILMFGGYVNDNVQGLQTATVRTYGHLQVVPKDFLDFGRGNPGRFSIKEYEALVERIRADAVLSPMLALVTPVLEVEGLAGNFALGVSSNFVGEGVVPEERRRQLSWDGFDIGIPPGQTVLSSGTPDAGVVGLRMAQLLSLCDALQISNCRRLLLDDAAVAPQAVTEKLPLDIAALAAGTRQPTASTPAGAVAIELLASSPGGMPNVVRMDVLKAERQGIRQIDSMYVALPLPLAQRLVFGPEQRAVSSIVVQLHQTAQLEAAQARLEEIVRTAGQPLEVLGFRDVSPVYDQIVATYTTIFQFIAWLMAAITLFSISNAVNMAVSERTGEIGTLRSLGFQRSTIGRIFVSEGAVLGVLGTLGGALMALVLAEGVINLAGLSWTPPGRSSAIPIRVDILSSPSLVLLTVLGLSAVACLSALWPASKAARLEITDALRQA